MIHIKGENVNLIDLVKFKAYLDDYFGNDSLIHFDNNTIIITYGK